jgi:hypothetical protein
MAKKSSTLTSLAVRPIARIKQDASRTAGYDIGTPRAVDIMLEYAQQLRAGTNGAPLDELSPEFADKVRRVRKLPTRQQFVRDYLFNREMNDEHGQNPLEGELRRSQALALGIRPAEVTLTT